MKTFVYHDGALGDVLLSLPCLRRLKADSGWVHLAGRGEVACFLKDAGVVDAAVSSDQSLFASLYSAIDPRLRTFLSGFERAWLFTAQKNPAAEAAIRTVIPGTRIIRTIPPDGSRLHAAQYRLSQTGPQFRHTEHPVLNIPMRKKGDVQSLLREAGFPETGSIAVHPGSGSRLKCWPLGRFFEMIERLQSANDSFVILFTGNGEDGEVRNEVRDFSSGRTKILHADFLDLTSAASLLSHCSLYIGNDSGFSHLAGILGCKTIVLFGPTDPVIWKPIGPYVEFVSAPCFGAMTEITVDDVIAKIESNKKQEGGLSLNASHLHSCHSRSDSEPESASD